MWLKHRVMRPKDANGIANSVDLIWVYTVCPGLSVRNLGSLRHVIYIPLILTKSKPSGLTLYPSKFPELSISFNTLVISASDCLPSVSISNVTIREPALKKQGKNILKRWLLNTGFECGFTERLQIQSTGWEMPGMQISRHFLWQFFPTSWWF